MFNISLWVMITWLIYWKKEAHGDSVKIYTSWTVIRGGSITERVQQTLPRKETKMGTLTETVLSLKLLNLQLGCLATWGARRHFPPKGYSVWEGVQAAVSSFWPKVQVTAKPPRSFPDHNQSYALHSQSSGEFLELIFVAKFSIKCSLRKLRSVRLNKQEAQINFP